jgi:hypothetical protein
MAMMAITTSSSISVKARRSGMAREWPVASGEARSSQLYQRSGLAVTGVTALHRRPAVME